MNSFNETFVSVESAFCTHLWERLDIFGMPICNCCFSCTGKGAIRLADAVLRAVEEPVEFKFLYDVKVSPIITVQDSLNFCALVSVQTYRHKNIRSGVSVKMVRGTGDSTTPHKMLGVALG